MCVFLTFCAELLASLHTAIAREFLRLVQRGEQQAEHTLHAASRRHFGPHNAFWFASFAWSRRGYVWPCTSSLEAGEVATVFGGHCALKTLIFFFVFKGILWFLLSTIAGTTTLASTASALILLRSQTSHIVGVSVFEPESYVLPSNLYPESSNLFKIYQFLLIMYVPLRLWSSWLLIMRFLSSH